MIPWIDPEDSQPFPDINTALKEPNGLLAAGGSLQPERLLMAYRAGIFPWFDEDQPILWWSPDPRMALKPSEIHISKSLKKFIKKNLLHCTYDLAFPQVISACAEPRPDQPDTWITQQMQQAYITLHQRGFAHSIEVWKDEHLVGGLYGVSIGHVFFGESMFSRYDNASKVGFVFLCEQLQAWGYQLIDAQVKSEHLESLGATLLPRHVFSKLLKQYCAEQPAANAWQIQNHA